MTEQKEQKETQKKDKIAPGTTRVKVGQFQLQTKSFWITVIAFITLFVFGVAYFTYYFSSQMSENNTKIIEKVLDSQQKTIELLIQKKSNIDSK